MVQKRGMLASDAEEGKRPKGNASDLDDSQSPPTMNDELMQFLEVSTHAQTGCYC